MSESKELMSLEELQASLKVVAVEEASAEKVSGASHLSTKGKKFSLGDEVIGKELDVVVVSTAYENAFYKGAYNPNKKQPPVCFAVAEDDSAMEPHDTSPEPQADDCASCPMNEWGSSLTGGKGKACKNGRRLVLLAYGKDGLSNDDPVVLRLPPTSLKNWAGYSKGVSARFELPTFAMVTRLSFDPNSDWPTVMFDPIGPIANAAELQTVISKRDEMLEVALEPYDVSAYDGDGKGEVPKKSKMS